MEIQWFVAVFLAALCNTARGQCNINPPTTIADKEIPNIFDISELSYQINVEVNYEVLNQTSIFTEYYVKEFGRGRLDILHEGERSRFYYIQDTSEAFTIKGHNCDSATLDAVPEFMNEMPWKWSDFKNDIVTYGPSAMLRNAYEEDKKDPNSVRFFGNEVNKVRGINVEHWRQCPNGLTVDYYFSDSETEMPYGFKKSVPLRVTVSGYNAEYGESLPQTYEFAPFQPYVSDLSKVELPRGMGCVRRGETDKPPTYAAKDLNVYAEVAYKTTDIKEDSDIDTWKYISYVQIGYDDTSKHLSYKYTPWVVSDDPTKPVEAGTAMKEVYDLKRKLAYKIDAAGNCGIERYSVGGPQFQLPDGKTVSLNDPLLLLNNTDFQLLGEYNVRGFDVVGFEKVFQGAIEGLTKGNTKVILTRYYLKKDIAYGDGPLEEQAPVQIQMVFIDTENRKWSHTLLINFFGFSTHLHNKPEVFNVQECFVDNDESVSFTLVYPGSNELIALAALQVPDIEMRVVQSIMRHSEATPLRLPKVLVDFDKSHVYATVRLLGRHPVDLDYGEETTATFVKYDETYAIVSQKECAMRCLETLVGCKGYSYCGATCYLVKDISQTNIRDQADCKMQKRQNDLVPVPSISKLENDIKAMVKEGSIRLNIFDPRDTAKQPVSIKATEVDFKRTYPVGTIVDDFGLALDERFTTQKISMKLKTGEEIGKNLGALEFTQCQSVCLSRSDCESISFCMLSTQCIISTKHGDEIADADMVPDTRCAIVTRRYTNHYNKFPGLVLTFNANKRVKVSDVESCARECSREKSFNCKSFEFCPDEKKDENCQLHKIHFFEAKNTGENSVKSSTECKHYSRKYIMDFEAVKQHREKGENRFKYAGVTPEECAKRCSETQGVACVAFDYCVQGTVTSTGDCELSTNVVQKEDLTTNQLCTRYTMNAEARDERTIKSGGGGTNKYTNSLAGGLGFLFFLIGGVLGVAGLFLYARWKVNKP